MSEIYLADINIGSIHCSLPRPRHISTYYSELLGPAGALYWRQLGRACFIIKNIEYHIIIFPTLYAMLDQYIYPTPYCAPITFDCKVDMILKKNTRLGVDRVKPWN